MSHSLHRGDCFEVMPSLESGTFDAIIADMPAWKSEGEHVALLENIQRLTKRSGVVVLMSQTPSGLDADRLGLGLFTGGCWGEGEGVTIDLIHCESSSALTCIAVYVSDRQLQRPDIHHKPTTVQKLRLHPQQKPVSLMRELIDCYTLPGNKILDFCMGSGSTGVAAVQSGRDFVGIEIDAAHYCTAKDRVGLSSLIYSSDQSEE